MSFTIDVLRVVRLVPPSQTMTYREVAIAAGRPRAYRAVGNILNRVWQTDHGTSVPCHRVIRSDGTPGGYAGGDLAKIERLASEKAYTDKKNSRPISLREGYDGK
jgi:methylated-DNA-[protein]-cysteine S-methyltransferase